MLINRSDIFSKLHRTSQSLAWLLVGFFLLFSSYARGEEVWDGSYNLSWNKGNGTELSPYTIETPAQLAYLSQQVQNGNSYKDKYFAQANDFNMNGGTYSFIPIGTNNSPFEGHFKGKNISNLNLQEVDGCAALFGYATDATIENVILSGTFTCNSSVTYLAGIVAIGNDVQLDNCHNNTKQISSAQYTGGLIAKTQGVCVIENCSNTSQVSGSNAICTYTGGLVAWNTGDIIIYKCYNTGKISSSTITNIDWGELNMDEVKKIIKQIGTFYPKAYTGGLIGYNQKNSSVQYSYNTGSLTSSAAIQYGIIPDGVRAIFELFEVPIPESTDSPEKYAFGIGHNCDVSYSYSAGSLDAFYMYGITDNSDEDKIINCFYKQANNVGGYGESTPDDDLKSDDMPARLEETIFTTDDNKSNGGYPIFAEQSSEGEYSITIASPSEDEIYIFGLKETYAENERAVITLRPKDPCNALDNNAYDENGLEYPLENNILIIEEVYEDVRLTINLDTADPFTVSVTASPSAAGTVCITTQ